MDRKNRGQPCPSELEARITEWVDYYNNQRYHEAIDNVTPGDRFYGKALCANVGETLTAWEISVGRLGVV